MKDAKATKDAREKGAYVFFAERTFFDCEPEDPARGDVHDQVSLQLDQARRVQVVVTNQIDTRVIENDELERSQCRSGGMDPRRAFAGEPRVAVRSQPACASGCGESADMLFSEREVRVALMVRAGLAVAETWNISPHEPIKFQRVMDRADVLAFYRARFDLAGERFELFFGQTELRRESRLQLRFLVLTR